MSSLWVLQMLLAGLCQDHRDQERVHAGTYISQLFPSTVVKPSASPVTQKVSLAGTMSYRFFARISLEPRSLLVICEPQKGRMKGGESPS